MGKTLTSVLEIVVGAVLIATGIGVGIGIALVGAGLVGLLTKIPKPPAMEGTQKIAIPPRLSCYGTVRTYGYYILFETDPNGNAVDCWVYHEGQIAEVIQYYIGDKRVKVIGGWVQAYDDASGLFGKGNNIIQAGAGLGMPIGAAFGPVIAAVPNHWTTAHRGDGCVTGYMISHAVKSKDYSKIYASGGPNQTPLSIAIKAQMVFDWRDETQIVTDPTSWEWSENAVLHTAHYLLVRMGKGWAKHFLPTLSYWTDAANDADIPMVLNGVQTTLIAKGSKNDTSVYLAETNGLAVGMTISIFVSGDNSQTEARVVTSITGVQAHFTTHLSNLHPMGSQVTWLSDPANPATEPRYSSCVSHQHTDAHKDVLAHLLACFDGWLAPRSDGALVVYSGRYVAPTDAPLGPDEIVSYSFQEGVNEEDAVNSIKVSYISANHDYNTVQSDDWTDEDDIEARGKVLSDSLDNQSPSFSQNRRCAKRMMAKINAPYRGTIVTTSSGSRFIGKRYVPINLTEAGTTFFSGVGEVQKMTRNLATGGITIAWIAVDPNIDEWDPAAEEGNPAPIGNHVANLPLDVPVITAAVPNFGTDSATGVAGVFIDLTADGPDRSDLTWYIRTRQTGYVTWGTRTYDDVASGTSVELSSEFVPSDASIDVEVSYGVGNGSVSDWSATTTVDTSSASIPPAHVTGLSATGGTGNIVVSYNTPSGATLASEKVYTSTGSSFSGASVAGTFTDAQGLAASHPITLAAGVWNIWVTTVSSAGAESTPVGPVSAIAT